MTIERYRDTFKEKAKTLSDEQIADQIAQDRQFIQSFIRLVVENKLTTSGKMEHYGN